MTECVNAGLYVCRHAYARIFLQPPMLLNVRRYPTIALSLSYDFVGTINLYSRLGALIASQKS